MVDDAEACGGQKCERQTSGPSSGRLRGRVREQRFFRKVLLMSTSDEAAGKLSALGHCDSMNEIGTSRRRDSVESIRITLLTPEIPVTAFEHESRGG